MKGERGEVATTILFVPVARTNRIKARVIRDFFPIAPAKIPKSGFLPQRDIAARGQLRSYSTTSSLTFATPLPTMPSDCAAE